MLINPSLLPLEEVGLAAPTAGTDVCWPQLRDILSCEPALHTGANRLFKINLPNVSPRSLSHAACPELGLRIPSPVHGFGFKLRSAGFLTARGNSVWAGGVAPAGRGEDRTSCCWATLQWFPCLVKFPVQCQPLLTRGNRYAAPPLTGSAGFWHLVTVPPILHREEKSLYFPPGWCKTMRGNTHSFALFLSCFAFHPNPFTSLKN